MSQSPPSYLDGVPVKIAEKYKPPIISQLPQNILQQINSDTVPGSYLEYDFDLERSVITKISEWKKVRESQCEARRERMRKAEAERLERQKQLLTAVSYPSAEDLSSDGEDDGSSPSDKALTPNTVQVNSTTQQQRFDTILTPTIVPDTSSQPNCNNIISNLNKINYSDFENDTSSPFDSVELKTINDLDILAQVLNVTQIHSQKEANLNNTTVEVAQNVNAVCNVSKPTMAGDNSGDINNTESTSSITAYNFSQSPNNFHTSYNNQQFIAPNYESMNGLPKQNNVNYYNQMAANQNQNYNNYIYNYNMMPDHTNYNMQTNHTYHSHGPSHCYSPTVFNSYAVIPPVPKVQDIETGNLQVKSKSKSVPDILKELNDEVSDAENRRKRNDSYSQRQVELESEEEQVNANNKESWENSEVFLKLSPSSQELVKNISFSMGFPPDRVSRVAEKYGNDDRKIIEHLIPLGELLDMGFEEIRITEALLKFDNDKEKALDFLIS